MSGIRRGGEDLAATRTEQLRMSMRRKRSPLSVTWTCWQGGSFQPAWVGNPELVSGHAETMEYANGIMEMFRVAADWGQDNKKPTSKLVPGGHPASDTAER
ncbi:hypothetical protein ABZ570_03810 [Micromonospora sp. NPDC007271]|uniref:hypothetical protein n=1 Tax=Micromonospora sp. NPDC007271 TaxID=3154587 RepID=UPI0033F09760